MRTPLYYDRIQRKLFWPTLALAVASIFNEGWLYLLIFVLMHANLLIVATCVWKAGNLHAERAEIRCRRIERASLLRALRS